MAFTPMQAPCLPTEVDPLVVASMGENKAEHECSREKSGEKRERSLSFSSEEVNWMMY